MKKKKINGYNKKKMKFVKWVFIIFDDTELLKKDN